MKVTKIIPTLRWSLDCVCPHCNKDIDLADIGHISPDDEQSISEYIFEGDWMGLDGYELECIHCDKTIVLGGVEY